MSKFTKSVQHEIEFEGDKITMKLSRLKRSDMQLLVPYLQKGEGGIDKFGFVEQAEFSKVAIGLLPNYVEDFSGLRDADGNAVSFDDVMTEMYFNEIVTAIVSRLFSVSKLTEEEEKNLDAPSDIATKDFPQEIPSIGVLGD